MTAVDVATIYAGELAELGAAIATGGFDVVLERERVGSSTRVYAVTLRRTLLGELEIAVHYGRRGWKLRERRERFDGSGAIARAARRLRVLFLRRRAHGYELQVER